MNSKIIDIAANAHMSRTSSHRNAILKSFHKDKKKIGAFASLASIFVLVTIANVSLLNDNSAPSRSGARGIASLSFENTRATSIEEARQVLRAIEADSERSPASLGKAPSLVDQLRFGFLEGKYALRMSDGKLNELEFVDTAQVSDRPKYVENGEKFIQEYQELLPVSFKSISKPQERLEGERFSQVYELKDSSDRVVGEASFVKDSVGRLLSFKVSSKK